MTPRADSLHSFAPFGAFCVVVSSVESVINKDAGFSFGRDVKRNGSFKMATGGRNLLGDFSV